MSCKGPAPSSPLLLLAALTHPAQPHIAPPLGVGSWCKGVAVTCALCTCTCCSFVCDNTECQHILGCRFIYFKLFVCFFSMGWCEVIACSCRSPWKVSESSAADDSIKRANSSGFPFPPVGITTTSFTAGSASSSSPYFRLPSSRARTSGKSSGF